jgi:hypothetical protein
MKSVTAEAGETAGVNLTIKGKPNWTPAQNADAIAKADALTAGETVVTKNPVKRDANLRSKFIKAGNVAQPGQQLDHTIDLQLGGTNASSNLKFIDGSVNASFGSQVNHQIKNLPDATRVNKVVFIPK